MTDDKLLWLCNSMLSDDENINIVKTNNLNNIIQYERNLLTDVSSDNKLYQENKYIYDTPWKSLYNNFLRKTYNYLYISIYVKNIKEYKMYNK